ncbi:peptidoglycan DD-metalloendopeptidase family protein [Ferruginibacter yonginensis]|uniref:Peptidoglycan DD-metalloendopeptidase family protein n=1 Tax=Ferruginibacter yonginensis TaxID=1310416 RepID=A0ABV8QT25_9BACT
MQVDLNFLLKKHYASFFPVVKINKEKDGIHTFDFTINNQQISPALIADTNAFSAYITQQLTANNATYGIGGYNENRVLYKRSTLFDGAQNRSIHLGVDIWGPVGTKVYAPLGGMVHSFAFNDQFGDYGATIILQHQLDTVCFYTLYGHLSLASLHDMRKGKFITRGEAFCSFGNPIENGNWPPHLHFQVIEDIGNYEGDYPGVCSEPDRAFYLKNCPDANQLINFDGGVFY